MRRDDQAVLCEWAVACTTTTFLPVQTQSVGREEHVLGHVSTRDVHEDVARHHLHERRPPAYTTGAGEARPLHGAGASHRFMEREG